MPEITYLMDRDPDGAGYFTEAVGYFAARPGNTVVEATGPRSLDEVLTDLRTRATQGTTYSTINLVSHATGFSSLSFPISVARKDDDGGIITTDTLKHALLSPGANGYPAVLGAPAVTTATSVVLYGCDVGRDAAFLTMLGQLFGPELTIYAPLRVAVFRHAGPTFEHRLARTWSTVHDRDVTTTTSWPPVRAALVAKLVARFATPEDPAVEAGIRAAAQSATATSAGSWFFAERLSTADDPATHTVTGSSAVLTAGTRDDTTVALSVTSPDFRPAGAGVWVAWVAVLAQVLEQPVSIEDGAQYRKTVIRAKRTASVTPLVPTRDPDPIPDPLITEDDMAFFGKYRGTVTDDADPASSGRLRVTVPAVGVSDVWAEASVPPVPTGLLRLPASGETVWVEFEAGDETKPIWTGATWNDAVDSTDVSLVTDGKLTLRARALELTSDEGLDLTAGMAVSVSGGTDVALTAGSNARIAAALAEVTAASTQVNAGMTRLTGVVHSDTVITNSVVSASYTPGTGNLY